VATEEPVIRMVGITKQFPNVLANDSVNLELYPREIHALLGENGAGKTTLMNILQGVYSPNAGQIFVNGKLAAIRNATDARKYGIGMVHQHFSLIPVFTVAENLSIGRKDLTRLNIAQVKSSITETAKRHGMEIDPSRRVDELSVGEQQKVEILKLLYRGASVLILDEPTSVLTPQESLNFFGTLRALKSEGKTIVVITHKLYEIFGVADRVTILRRGRVVLSSKGEGLTKEAMTRAMIGRDIEAKSFQPGECSEKGSLRLENVSVTGDRRELAVSEVTLEARRGEILGIAGVAGNGQKELIEAIFGLRELKAGEILLDDVRLTELDIKGRARSGLGYIPEERRVRAVASNLTLSLNGVLHDYKSRPYAANSLLQYSPIRKFAANVIERFSVASGREDLAAKNLSGGNLEKFIVGREIMRQPKYLLAVNPTYGLDVGAAEYVRTALVDSRNRGLGIILVSEDLDELISISDRIMVAYRGRLSKDVRRADFDKLKIGAMMLGEGFLSPQAVQSGS